MLRQEAATTIQRISEGRLTLGLAVGRTSR